MLSKDDLYYIINHLDKDESKEGEKLRSKLDLLYQQMDLQEEFRLRSLELQKKQEALNK